MPTILREIDVDIVRINPRGSARGSPQYVFAVHPLSTRAQRPSDNSNNSSRESAIASIFIDSTLHPIDENELPTVHEVARMYSQCWTLYKNLKKLTNGAKKSACRCCCETNDDIQGSDEWNQQPQQSACPCGALFSLLDAFMFPRKRLLRRRSRCVFQEQRFALNLFIKSVLQKLQSFHDHGFEQIMQQQHQRQHQHSDPFREDDNPTPHVTLVRCKVITALLRFLALEDAMLASKIREMSQRLFGKLSLEGWQSDRKNLYFINEDNEGSHANDDDSKRNNTVSYSSHISNSQSSSVVEERENLIVGSSLDLEAKRDYLER